MSRNIINEVEMMLREGFFLGRNKVMVKLWQRELAAVLAMVARDVAAVGSAWVWWEG